MPVVKLTPSHYDRSSSTYVTVTDAANMYNDASHMANYASIRGRGGTSSNSTYYFYLNGFDFSGIPADAVINSFTVKIRCSRNTFQSDNAAYRIRLATSAANAGVVADTTASVSIDTSVSVITVPTGALQWSDIVGASSFSIQVRLRNTSTLSSDYPYVYIYGAEIEVNYSIVDSPADIHSNYYKMTSYGGWSPCIEGNNAYGLRPFSGSVLPNCSGYATGRFNELLGLNACTWLGSYNGSEFIDVARSQGLGTGLDPVVGGIIAWGDPGSEGHVAVVEQVIDNDHIVTSESGWNYSTSPVVRTVNRTRGANNRWDWPEECKGFAYPPGVPGQAVDYYMLFLEDE